MGRKCSALVQGAQIARLTPAILGPPAGRRVAATIDTGAKIAVLAKQAGRAMSVFAVNYDEKYKRDARTHPRASTIIPGGA